MSDTPLTDALHVALVKRSEGPHWIAGKDYCDMRDHARTLERDLAAARAESSARKAALEFAAGAIGDAIYTEDGLDGDAGQRVLHIIGEARDHGTFDEVNGKHNHDPFVMLDAARAECEEQARLNGMGSEREARLMAERDEAWKAHTDALQAWQKDRDALAEALRMAREHIGKPIWSFNESAVMSRIDTALGQREER